MNAWEGSKITVNLGVLTSSEATAVSVLKAGPVHLEETAYAFPTARANLVKNSVYFLVFRKLKKNFGAKLKINVFMKFYWFSSPQAENFRLYCSSFVISLWFESILRIFSTKIFQDADLGT